ncbi:hypothetical protein [Parvularcula sp. LCG005]|uniref:hypothetical protein n=1 Tax=Parvularcula sp. LCG005 TaxID=3078805 RepID=UPI002942A02A|nr:hypothetical protein [Parvularcula sp. LCG005]WOI54418.1 hypothetical protein RUI03_05300 [Parvularcula sp. LCG005]
MAEQNRNIQNLLQSRGERLKEYPISHALTAFVMAHHLDVISDLERLNKSLRAIYADVSASVQLAPDLRAAQESLELLARSNFGQYEYFLSDLKYFPDRVTPMRRDKILPAIYAVHFGAGRYDGHLLK